MTKNTLLLFLTLLLLTYLIIDNSYRFNKAETNLISNVSEQESSSSADVIINKYLLTDNSPAPVRTIFNNVILQSDFDDQSLKLFLNNETFRGTSSWNVEKCCNHSIQLVPDPVRTGYSVQFIQGCNDPLVSNGLRAEIKISPSSNKDMQKDRWYSFKTYLPIDWNAGKTSNHLIVAQWHEIPDWNLGENWRSPPLSLQLFNNQWMVAVINSSLPVNSYNSSTGKSITNGTVTQYMLGSFEPDVGRWVSWTFHVKWFWDNRGTLEVWKDDKKVVERLNLPVCFNDVNGPYFKAGIYRSSLAECPITILEDDFLFW
jgi:hypothetical protein